VLTRAKPRGAGAVALDAAAACCIAASAARRATRPVEPASTRRARGQQRHGVRPRHVRAASARARWGSCWREGVRPTMHLQRHHAAACGVLVGRGSRHGLALLLRWLLLLLLLLLLLRWQVHWDHAGSSCCCSSSGRRVHVVPLLLLLLLMVMILLLHVVLMLLLHVHHMLLLLLLLLLHVLMHLHHLCWGQLRW
jgi:hypothetical protein